MDGNQPTPLNLHPGQIAPQQGQAPAAPATRPAAPAPQQAAPRPTAPAQQRPIGSRLPAMHELQGFAPDGGVLSANNIVGFSMRDIRSRPFSLLRSQIVRKMAANNWRLLGITSATPAVGKSFISANLAAALSRLPDKQIYLFDLDLRRASLGNWFGLDSDVGLSEYFAGEVLDTRVFARRFEQTNLAFFPTAAPTMDSLDLVASTRFDDLVTQMRALPEEVIVLCDLSPVFANDEAMMIVEKLDAYLMVIEQGVTTPKQVQDTMRMLDSTPCIGTVLNRYSGGLQDDYGYGYGYGYGHKYGKYYGA